VRVNKKFQIKVLNQINKIYKNYIINIILKKINK